MDDKNNVIADLKKVFLGLDGMRKFRVLLLSLDMSFPGN
jgi:hypothetical protein